MPETPSQPIGQAARSLDSASVLDRLNRYCGCLLAGACGDALGAPVEFWRRHQIIDHFGEPGITDYLTAYGRVGEITDDTQMTLFTAVEVRCTGCGMTEGGVTPPACPQTTLTH